jgi:hypothetical protein
VPEEDKRAEPLCHDIKLNTKAGDFILFDSRTFHGNTLPMRNCLRACTYVCMIPAQSINEKRLKERQKAFKELRTTTHHPLDFTLFAEMHKEGDAFTKLIGKANQFQMDEEIQALI